MTTPAPVPFLNETDYDRLREHFRQRAWDWGLVELAHAAGKDIRDAAAQDATRAFHDLSSALDRLPYWAWQALTSRVV